MNKYQEALDSIVKYLHKNNVGSEKELRKYSKLLYLQELVDKETPKKVKSFSNSFYIKICPNCGSTLETKRNYCDECGQKLDWSEDNEI